MACTFLAYNPGLESNAYIQTMHQEHACRGKSVCAYPLHRCMNRQFIHLISRQLWSESVLDSEAFLQCRPWSLHLNMPLVHNPHLGGCAEQPNDRHCAPRTHRARVVRTAVRFPFTVHRSLLLFFRHISYLRYRAPPRQSGFRGRPSAQWRSRKACLFLLLDPCLLCGAADLLGVVPETTQLSTSTRNRFLHKPVYLLRGS